MVVGRILMCLCLRTPEEEALEEDSGANVSLNEATSGGADGFTSKKLSAGPELTSTEAIFHSPPKLSRFLKL